MKLQEASDFFQSLKSATTEQDEIIIYDTFLYMLDKFESSKLSQDELQSIEVELDNLDLKSVSGDRKIEFNRKLSIFQRYLRIKLSMTTKRYYSIYYTILGTSWGFILGLVLFSYFDRTFDIPVGLIFGMLMGFFSGQIKDSMILKKGRLL